MSANLFRVLTLPKSGTHLIKKLFEAPVLANRIGVEVTHVIRADCYFEYDPRFNTAMTIRHPVSYFYSLVNWCDRRCAQILDEGLEFPGMHTNRATSWARLSMHDKLTALVQQSDQSLYRTELIDVSFAACCSLFMDQRVLVLRYEDLTSRHPDGTFSRIQIESLNQLFRFAGIALDEQEIHSILQDAWGDSETFHKADPMAWQRLVPPDIKTMIYEKYDLFVRGLGYANAPGTKKVAA